MLKITNARLCDNSSFVALECLSDRKSSNSGEKNEDGRLHKTVFYILPDDYALLNPQKGPADEQTEAEIIRLDEKCRALRTARRLLEYSSNTSSGLVLKLRKRGYSKAAATFAVEVLCDGGEIDEERDVMRAAELSVKKGRGRMRVIPELKQKGYSDEALKTVYAYLDSVDFSEICATVIKKKYREFPQEPDERRKAVAALLRLGFSSTDIKKAISK